MSNFYKDTMNIPIIGAEYGFNGVVVPEYARGHRAALIAASKIALDADVRVNSLETDLAAANAEITRLRAGGCAKGQATTQWCAEAQRLAEDAAILDWLADHEVVQDVDGVNPDIHDIARRISDNQGRQKQSTIKTYRQALRQMIRAAMDEKRNDDSGL